MKESPGQLGQIVEQRDNEEEEIHEKESDEEDELVKMKDLMGNSIEIMHIQHMNEGYASE